MLLFVNILLAAAATLLLVPVLVVCAECLLALLPARRRRAASEDSAARPRVAVLIPAHNEESGLATTVRSILPQLGQADRILVVADNCTDDTAAVARLEGCSVLERHDDERRGKGYALDAGVRHLDADPPDVLVMMDADCIVHEGAVDALVRQAAATGRPAQAVYLMTYPEGAAPTQAVSALAFLVKNRVRPRGLDRLGLPCLLTGTGMSFPWSTIRGVDLASGNIVEDMQLGLDLALAGHAPRFCEAARVTGQLPSADKAAYGQRTRWEHGHLRTLLGQVPRLVAAGLFKGRLSALPIALELAVPPLSLLIVLIAIATAAAYVAALLGASWIPAWALSAGLALLVACLLLAWLKFARRTLPLTSLLSAPVYVLWKLPMYATFLRRRQKEWVRTERDAAPSGPAVKPR